MNVVPQTLSEYADYLAGRRLRYAAGRFEPIELGPAAPPGLARSQRFELEETADHRMAIRVGPLPRPQSPPLVEIVLAERGEPAGDADGTVESAIRSWNPDAIEDGLPAFGAFQSPVFGLAYFAGYRSGSDIQDGFKEFYWSSAQGGGPQVEDSSIACVWSNDSRKGQFGIEFVAATGEPVRVLHASEVSEILTSAGENLRTESSEFDRAIDESLRDLGRTGPVVLTSVATIEEIVID